MTEEMAPTPYQARVLSVPETVDLFLGDGRGGGKSHCKALLILRHVEQYREKARVLYVRRTYKGLADFELVLRSLFSAAYGSAASYNSTEHVFRLPYGYLGSPRSTPPAPTRSRAPPSLRPAPPVRP